MLPLSQKLLAAAGFEYDAMEQTWVVPVPLPPLVTVECHGGDGNGWMRSWRFMRSWTPTIAPTTTFRSMAAMSPSSA